MEILEPDNIEELNELNKLQADQHILEGGEYGFQKEGFEEGDFSGDEFGDGDEEMEWGTADDMGVERSGAGEDFIF